MSNPFLSFKTSKSSALKFSLLLLPIIIGALLLSLSKHPEVQDYFRKEAAKDAVATYADNTVITGIQKLVIELENFDNAVSSLETEKAEFTFKKVIDKFHAAYGAWDRMAAFLHGPAAQYDYHKQLASWPCEKVLMEHLMDRMDSGEIQLTERYLRDENVANMRGFHAAHYLLYKNGQERSATELSKSEIQYLRAISQAMLLECIDFEASWAGTKALSSEKRLMLKTAGFRELKPYTIEFKEPGTKKSRYISLSIPLQEMLGDMSAVVEEMHGTLEEVAEPIPAAERRYWHSIDAYSTLKNHLQSVENAYLGGWPMARKENSLSALVAIHDKSLDRLIKISLAHSAKRIEDLEGLTTKGPETRDLLVKRAAAELDKLLARLTVAAPQVVLDPVVEPFAAYIDLGR